MRTIRLRGIFRALAWEPKEHDLLVVGNGGNVIEIHEDQVTPLDSGTKHNLRAVSANPSNGKVLIAGNAGTLLLHETGLFRTLHPPTFENLRSVSWHPNGTTALITGNNGTLLKYSGQEFKTVDAGRANLRGVAWHPKSNTALACSNCFAEEFIPSTNLFSYDAETNLAKPVNEGRADLIGVDWKPTGESALAVGYDVVWHNGLIGNFDGTALSPIQFDNKRVYPVGAAWKPTDNMAAIVTATVEQGIGKGTIFLWNGKTLNPVYSDQEFFFSDTAWDPDGNTLAALASTATRTFNV